MPLLPPRSQWRKPAPRKPAFTLQGFVSWLRKQSKTATYDYNYDGSCPNARFHKACGRDYMVLPQGPFASLSKDMKPEILFEVLSVRQPLDDRGLRRYADLLQHAEGLLSGKWAWL